MAAGIAVLVSRAELDYAAVLPGNNVTLLLHFLVYFGVATIAFRFFTGKNTLVWRVVLAWALLLCAFLGSCLHPVNSSTPIRRAALLDANASSSVPRDRRRSRRSLMQ